MRVTVLYGGPSAEREVSLVSGKAVIDGLRSMGHDVFGSDVSPTDLSGLDRPADVVFPVLHGQFGESGELQEILEQRNLAFVGSGSRASRLGMDKVRTKQAWEKAGLPTPRYRVITPADRPFPEDILIMVMDAFNLMHEPLVRLMPERDPAEVALLSRMMFSAVHGIISLGLEERMIAVPPESLRQQVAQFVDTHLRGLGILT